MYLTIDPLINSKKLSFCMSHGDDGSIISSKITLLPRDEIQNDSCVLVYDASRTFTAVGIDKFFWDVKTLYELQNYQFKSIVELGQQILGLGAMERYVELSGRIKAYIKSYTECRIPIQKYSLDKILPEELLNDFYGERGTVIAKLFVAYSHNAQKAFYKDNFFNAMKVIDGFSRGPIAVNLDAIKGINNHYATSLRKAVKNDQLYLKFKYIAAATGRLGFEKNSVNFYSLPKTMRSCIVASEGAQLVQMDFKSFQPRLAIFSTEDEAFKKSFQGTDDIYSVFAGDREKNKITFLAWMFAKYHMRNNELDTKAYAIWRHRKKLYQDAKVNGYITNVWGRVMPYKGEPEHIVFQHYITSIEVDSVLNMLVFLDKFLLKYDSQILLPYHDAIIFEVFDYEKHLIKEIKTHLQDSLYEKFGAKFPVQVSVGDDFGHMNVISA